MLALVFLGGSISFNKAGTVEASVNYGHEYQGTTTSTGRFPTLATIKTGSGSLGSVIITGAATGIVHIYDATTTNVSLRTGNKATSTIYLASFPTSAATGTYTFDRNVFDGIIVETIGTMPTTTITFR